MRCLWSGTYTHICVYVCHSLSSFLFRIVLASLNQLFSWLVAARGSAVPRPLQTSCVDGEGEKKLRPQSALHVRHAICMCVSVLCASMPVG